MKKSQIFLIVLLLLSLQKGFAQQIYYSEPDRDDIRSISFEVAGKTGNNYLIYKSVRNNKNMYVYDSEMKMIAKEEMPYLPDRIINSDIVNYKDNSYFIYQYQKKNIVYCMAANLDPLGKIIGEPTQLDTTEIGFFANNKIYNVISSEDKQRIAIYKINSRNQTNLQLTTNVFDASLQPISHKTWHIPMLQYNDFLARFDLDNKGQMVILKANGNLQNESIKQLSLITADPMQDSLFITDIDINDVFLDDIHVKVDNFNNNYVITSFFSPQKRGYIDGIFCAVWSRNENKMMNVTITPFDPDLRENARSEGSIKTAFNDYFIQDILMRKNGGYAIIAESVYSNNRNSSPYNRWDNMNGNSSWTSSDVFLINNGYRGYYPWWGTNPALMQSNRYFADNIAVLSFDSLANMTWGNIVHKSQYDDGTDNTIGFGLYKTNSNIQFLYNEFERRNQLLSLQSVDTKGEVEKMPTLRNLDQGYVFMPRYAKQTGAKELIIPCIYRNFICFARVVF